MRLDVEFRAARGLRQAWIGACAAWLVMGCGAIDRELLEDLFDGRGHGHSGGGHGHGGHGHGGSGGGGGGNDCGFITSDDVLANVARDLASLDIDDRSSQRYLSLADRSNAGTCGADLDEARAALVKLVNSLSTDTTLTQLVSIDVGETLYRLDMRDYAWDRAVEVGGTDFVDAWEAIVASSPYAVPFVGDDADGAKLEAGTSVPVLSGSAFVAAASNAPVYYGVLGIPENVDDFILDDLAIDVAENRIEEEAVRAGLGGTGVSGAEFLAERHEIEVRLGYLWQIFSDEEGAQALIDDPLSTPPSAERELAFTLPNGLLAHVLADADGRRIDDSALTLDTDESNFRATIARSYTKFRAQGVQPTDLLRDIALDDPRFDDAEKARIRNLYPTAVELARIVEADRTQFVAAALAGIGLDIDDRDPIDATFREFDRDVDATTAAAELYVSREELLDNLLLLDPAMGVLRDGTLDRQDFDALYQSSLCILGVVNENPVDPAVCE
jgi:hypothetical protein